MIYKYINSFKVGTTVSRSPLTAKGNGTESVISARCTQPFTFPGISLGENSAHQLLISPVPITAGWAEAPWDEKFAQHFYTWVTVLPYQPCHQQPCHHYRLPPWVNHVWRLPCHHIYIATISQTRLTIALPPSVKHGWRLPCHQSDTADFCLATSQTRLTFVLPPTSQTRLTFALPPMSRTPCPVVTNVLDIQHLRLRAIYTVHCSWMNIAVCKQVSGWLTLDIVYTWKLTYSWILYHLCDPISIFIKQISLSHHLWRYLLMWQKLS